jgi:ribosomal protein S18 acetylase RimI-like enzyme
MMTIRRAVPGDLRTVLAILHSVSRWLHERGYEQWPEGSPSLGPVRIGAQIDRGEFWIASEDRDPIAVIAVSGTGDPDFWTNAELDEMAAYISKAAVVRTAAGRGIGAMLLRWAVDRAVDYGASVVRLDVWRTNAELQAYYRRQGWEYVRTVPAVGRNSGALFQRGAVTDPEARDAFTLLSAREPVPAVVERGTPVIVTPDGIPVSATVTEATSDAGYGDSEAGWEHGTGGMPRIYVVERGAETWVAREAWPDPAPVT